MQALSRREFVSEIPAALAGAVAPDHLRAAAGLAPELKPLYRRRFRYTAGWEVPLAGPGNSESQGFFLAEGACEGRIQGRFRGANHPHRRSDGTYQPDFQGVIETEDGAVVYFDYQGYGRTYPAARRQIVSSAIHLSGDERYSWLNDVGTGEVRTQAGRTELVLDVMELVWQPIPE